MMFRFLSTMVLLLAVFLAGRAENSEILFRRVSPDGGFSYGFVNTIAEDSFGFIWFGTENGLYRYDTKEIIAFLNEDKPGSILSNNIVSLYLSKDKVLWVVTDKGLCYYDQQTAQFKPKRYDEPGTVSLNLNVRDIRQNNRGGLFTMHLRHVCQIDTLSGSYSICPIDFTGDDMPSSIHFDQSDVLWVGTDQGNIFKSQFPYHEFHFVCQQRDASIRTICADNNSIWIGYEWGGADHLTKQGVLIDHFDQENTGPAKLPHNRVRKIIKHKNNDIWIATYKGIYIVSRDGNKTVKADNYNELPHSSVKDLFLDSHSGIWAGTWSGGLAYHNENDNRFLHFKKNSDPNSIQSNIISSFSEDQSNNIWIGTEDNGLQVFNRDNKTFTNYRLKKPKGSVSNIKCLAQGKNSELWIGTLYDGLWRLDLQTKQYQNTNLFDDNKVRIYKLLGTDEGLWIATFGNGLFFYDFSSKALQKFVPRSGDSTSISSAYVRTIFKDSYGGLWVGTHNGLNYKAKGSDQFQRYFADGNVSSGNPTLSVSNNEIYAVLEDSDGQIWIGTENGLNSFNPNSSRFNVYKKEDGLSGTSIYGIQEDHLKQLWISTENGLSVFNLKNQSVRIFDTEDGLQGKQFNPGANYQCRNGEMLFGGPNGFNLIDPATVKQNPNPAQVIVTNLYINNKLAGASEGENSIGKSMIATDHLKLDYHQNTLTFEFVTANFIQPAKNEFKYRLANYNDDWVYSGNENKATFTKIPPGKYLFEVVGSNNNGIWAPYPKRLQLEIIPPLWARWYAYLIYSLSFVLLIWYVRKEVVLRQNLRKQLLFERVKNENEEKLYQLKMKFFTNITHEFRTPLTLILSPLDYIIRKNNHEPDTLDHLDLVKRNALRLKILINQIIDFRKLELGKTTLHLSHFELVKLCTDIFSSFDVYAKDKSIDFNFHATNQNINIQADPDKIEKVLLNLLSNAFKHTPDGGRIDFSIQLSSSIESNTNLSFITNKSIQGAGVEIAIKNTGKMIPGEQLPQLFNRFYADAQGAGIGLHLCNEYALLHHGSIATLSNEEGTIFKLILPLKGHASKTAEDGHKISKKMSLPEKSEKVKPHENANLKTILIIEDNTELLRYLRHILMQDYHVLVAEDGRKGLELANKNNPHLIISDILMPEIDGLELCQTIKQDIHTSHIPVILLTALSEKDKKIDGFNFGADAYIEKPFDDQLLLVQVRNLLNSRERLQQSFIQSIDQWRGYSDSLPYDKQLVEKAIKVIEAHLLDENFTVEQLASELNFSRSSLHRKLRDLTNQSATEFIRSVRLNKAVALMKQGNYNMEEIAYAVGFSSPSYFSQSFKKQFNQSPKAYLEELKQQVGMN